MRKYFCNLYTQNSYVCQNIIDESNFDSFINKILSPKPDITPFPFYVSSHLQNNKLIIKVLESPNNELFQIHIQEQ